MASTPGKKKPPTPPKPPLGHLPGNPIESSIQRSVIEHNAVAEKSPTPLLKSKTEATQANVIKCANDRPAVKPPLLPKPQNTPPKPLAISPKPLNLKRPNLVPPNERNGKVSPPSPKPKISPGKLNIKAPVAKLEEFDSIYDGPVRPPRSPKNQPFKGSPFQVHEEKPELPLKKRQLSFIGSDSKFQALQSQWQTTKEKSASLGRNNAFRFVGAKAKSASLGRNKQAEFASYLVSEAEAELECNIAPVPPPRQRRKSCETVPSPPVYAQVNYSMKKNRRQATEMEECKELSEDECVVEGRLVLPGRQCIQSEEIRDDKQEVEKTAQVDPVVDKEMSVGEDLISGSSDHTVNGCEISEDKTCVSGDSSSIDSRTCSIETVVSVSNSSQLYRIIRSKSIVGNCDGDKDLVIEDERESDSNNQVHDKFDEVNTDTVVEVDQGFASEELSGKESGKQQDENQHLAKIDACLTADEEPAKHVSEEIANQQLADEHIDKHLDVKSTDDCHIVEESSSLQCDDGDSKQKLDVVNSPNKQCEDDRSTNSESFDQESMEQVFTSNEQVNETPVDQCRSSTLSLPTRRQLDMKDTENLHRRRQSWSSCKNEVSSPDKALQSKRRPKSRSWWCDEGELSSGTLGDVDSPAHQSSFEEVGSDEDLCRRRSKLSCWLGSFGKGNRKKRKNSNTQFYCDSEVKSSEGDVADQESEGKEVEVDNSMKDLSILDSEQKSDFAISEDSFDYFQHSESENEADVSVDVNENGSDSEESRQNKKSFYIARELMTSERVFIDVLKLLNVDFRNYVLSSDIPDIELNKILNSLPQLQHLNEDLLRDLEDRIENWESVTKISDVIVRKGPFLKLYTSYIKNFEFQCNYLDECCQKYPRFAKRLKEFECSQRCQKLTLKHYMLKPVQRIPQYRLLLEDYLRHLLPSSPDLEDTKTALKIVCDVADHANRSIKLGDHLSKLLQLQSQLGNYEIIKPGRIFLKDGELFKLSRKGMQPRYFILLNDCLLYTTYYGTVQSTGLKVNYELPLSSMKVNIPQSEDYRHEFSIISVRRSFTLCARSLQEREEWVDALQKAISDYFSRQLSFQNMKIAISTTDSTEPFKLGQQAPVWIQDSRVTMCQSCTAVFTVTFRRHHCRACGKVVCGDCSDFRAPLQYMKFQTARICEECHDTLLKDARDPSSTLHQAMRRELGNTVKITDLFKRLGPASGKKIKKYIPQRLKEVTANDTGSLMSGWLQRKSRRSWKRLWFVLKEQVLYVYKASEDVVALETLPVLGYSVECMKEKQVSSYEGVDARLVFQLNHPGQQPHIFHADNEHLANRWVAAICEATVLK